MAVVIAVNKSAYDEVQRYRNSGKIWKIKSSHDTTVFNDVNHARDYLDDIGRIWKISGKPEGQCYIDSLKGKCKAGKGGKDYMEELKMENSNREHIYIYAFVHRSSNGEITLTFSYHCLTTDGSLGERVYDYLKREAGENLQTMLPRSADFRWNFIS